jgi:prepilin signal peptidase PulO-like enzyme (type II secretory pathway)
MVVVFYAVMFMFGAAFGSFLCCQAWRLRVVQERLNKGGKGKKSGLGKRSVCMHCKKQLKWYDNIPIISWLFLKGKCRYCKKRIGISEILAEVLTGILFLVLAYLFISKFGGEALLNGLCPTLVTEGNGIIAYSGFAILVLLSLVLVFLSIYDGKWGELPTVFLVIACILAGISWLLRGFYIGFSVEYVWQTIGALVILAGLYELLYLVSKGRWVGDGDAILCIALALGLSNVWLAVFVLFLSNTLGCFYALPSVARNKKKDKPGQLKIYFGPFLVIAFFIVLLFSDQILSLIKF